jgi:hypothetical protein
MNSPFRYAGAIIARPIAMAMKLHGGKMPVLIRPSVPARSGWKRIRCRRLWMKWAAKARPLWPLSAPIKETPAVIGRSANEAKTPKRSQLSRLALNDFLQADRCQPPKRP